MALVGGVAKGILAWRQHTGLTPSSFGLGVWFAQTVTQTKLLVEHMSMDSVKGRLAKIDE